MENVSRGQTSLQQKPRACNAFGITDKGRVRAGNEDAFLCNPDAGIFVVCDGMGGAAAGEVASRLAAENANAALLAGECSADASSGEFSEECIRVFAHASSDRRLEGMGTTLVMLALSATGALVAHVGDSRCYLWRDAALTRLTADHSLVEEQVRLGQITRRQAERSALQHVITRAIGTGPDVMPDVQQIEVRAGDLFLLASDGLTKELGDEQLGEMLGGSPSEQGIAEALIAAANVAGGRDNITCILVRIL
jgi:serine/threonine protein phosphatase PrpC